MVALPESRDSVVKKRRLWLTKVAGGRYILTKKKPVTGYIDGTDTLECDAPFDALAVRHLCEAGVMFLLGSVLPPLTPTRIELSARILPNQHGVSEIPEKALN